jgi:REP element-mobilizing transposase RayT
VQFSGLQARGLGRGFDAACRRSGYTIWACAILPEHTHLVVARHRYPIEQVAILLKGEATRQLMAENLHPLAAYAPAGRRPPRMWSEHQWQAFLDSEEAIVNAIRYVEANPEKEGKPPQRWAFVSPFAGLERGAWITYP